MVNFTRLSKDRHVPPHQLTLSENEEKILTFSLVSIGVIVGLLLVANAQTFFRAVKSLIFSQRKHLQSAIAKLDIVKSEGYLQAVKGKKFYLVFPKRKGVPIQGTNNEAALARLGGYGSAYVEFQIQCPKENKPASEG